jgi:hypothetical protein
MRLTINFDWPSVLETDSRHYLTVIDPLNQTVLGCGV